MRTRPEPGREHRRGKSRCRQKLDRPPSADREFLPVYFGGQNGEFIRQPAIKMPDDDDPRQRPWYQSAIAVKRVIMTKPYISASTKKLVMTIATPVEKDGVLSGGAGADLDLETVETFLRSFDIGGKGHVFLIDEDGVVLVHPDPQKITQDVTAHLGRLTTTTGRVGDTSVCVLGASRALAGQADRLQGELASFVRDIRTGE